MKKKPVENLVDNNKIILFDGICKLCNAWTRFIVKFDHKKVFKLCSVQSSAGQEILEYYGYSTSEFTTMLFIEQGKIYDKTSAFMRVVRQLPWPIKFLAVSWIIPLPIRNWLYDRIANNRYQIFGQTDTCLVPDERNRNRFL